MMERHEKDSARCFRTYLKAGKRASATIRQVSRGCVNKGAKRRKDTQAVTRGAFFFIGLFLFSFFALSSPPLCITLAVLVLHLLLYAALFFRFCFYDNTLRTPCCDIPYSHFLYTYTSWHFMVPEMNSILCAYFQTLPIVITEHSCMTSFLEHVIVHAHIITTRKTFCLSPHHHTTLF